MSRWLFLAALVVGILVLAAIAVSPALHAVGETDCSELDGESSEPAHGSHESDMYADGDGYSDCPADDGAAMGALSTTIPSGTTLF